jgi:hypothetical protein
MMLARAFDTRPDAQNLEPIEVAEAPCHIPDVTHTQVHASPHFEAAVALLGGAAEKGWVCPVTKVLGLQTFAHPWILHDMEGGAHITAVIAKESHLYLEDVRARMREQQVDVFTYSACCMCTYHTYCMYFICYVLYILHTLLCMYTYYAWVLHMYYHTTY